MRAHSGEKPFECSICQSAFTQTCHLSRRMMTHSRYATCDANAQLDWLTCTLRMYLCKILKHEWLCGVGFTFIELPRSIAQLKYVLWLCWGRLSSLAVCLYHHNLRIPVTCLQLFQFPPMLIPLWCIRCVRRSHVIVELIFPLPHCMMYACCCDGSSRNGFGTTLRVTQAWLDSNRIPICGAASTNHTRQHHRCRGMCGFIVDHDRVCCSFADFVLTLFMCMHA